MLGKGPTAAEVLWMSAMGYWLASICVESGMSGLSPAQQSCKPENCMFSYINSSNLHMHSTASLPA